jgi:O-antigen ligase
VDSDRYAYWSVAARTWADHPLAGAGASAFQVAWLRERPIGGGARDAHSLPLETLAELGAAGLLLLACAAGGIAVCARRVQGADPVLAAGPAAALAAAALHASLDWDWEMPALTLVSLTLAAVLVARADEGSSAYGVTNTATVRAGTVKAPDPAS